VTSNNIVVQSEGEEWIRQLSKIQLQQARDCVSLELVAKLHVLALVYQLFHLLDLVRIA
jgi:hypothetical protein